MSLAFFGFPSRGNYWVCPVRSIDKPLLTQRLIWHKRGNASKTPVVSPIEMTPPCLNFRLRQEEKQKSGSNPKGLPQIQ